MEKTMITKAIAYLVVSGLEVLCKRTDNPVDDNCVAGLKKILGFGGK